MTVGTNRHEAPRLAHICMVDKVSFRLPGRPEEREETSAGRVARPALVACESGIASMSVAPIRIRRWEPLAAACSLDISNAA